MTKAIIVYSKTQNVRRRVILLDDDSHMDIHANNIASGEDILIVEREDYHSIGADNLLMRHTGRKPSSDRCVVIDSDGCVKRSIKADPSIDSHPDGEIMRHDYACLGWIMKNGELTAPDLVDEPKKIRFLEDSLATIVPPGLYSSNAEWPSIGNISISDNNLSIGCETHTIQEWKAFKDSRIALMDPLASAWWSKYKSIVFDIATKHAFNCNRVKGA